ncbi:MAG: GNAT family N-acetyltransferase [Alphaproteobacteria bacterium]|nr:GNAT family N-acetyltransferase [Alphaproteobacteria bacterium]
MTRDEIVPLEEMNFNAWPALRTEHYDGWVLRSTGGDSRRVNSINPMTPGVIPLAAKIAAAEGIYARWGRDAVFRLTPLADPGLDEALVARGYVVEAPTFVQVADVAAGVIPADLRIFTVPDAAWIDAAAGIRGLSGGAAEVFAAQHRAVAVEAGWALLVQDGRPAAVGVVAIERGWAGLLGIYVAKFARRHGLARHVSQGLLAHAHAKEATRAWLQVEQANSAALPLYAALGFRTAYAYHHRVRSNRA